MRRSNFQRRMKFHGEQIVVKFKFLKVQNLGKVKISGRPTFWEGQIFGEVKILGMSKFLGRSNFWQSQHFGVVNISEGTEFWEGHNFGEEKISGHKNFREFKFLGR